MALWDIFQCHTGRVIHKWAHYFPVYERFFQQYIGSPVVIFEIGVGKGGSLQMWKKYFGPYAVIVGVDIKPECQKFEEEQISIRIGSQSDTDFLKELIDEFGTPDIVLDDGSHVMTDILTTFNYLYPRINNTGVYFVEDLHTAYWDEYEGGLRKKGTFIERCKDLIDELNADHSRGALAGNEFTKTTLSMSFYDSIVVFEKGECGKKYAPKIGGSS